jgi:hypothetical protein
MHDKQREPHFGPRPQTDQEAASSAQPDTDRPPLWDDPGWDAYLLAVDPFYRFAYDVAHGIAPEDEDADIAGAPAPKHPRPRRRRVEPR